MDSSTDIPEIEPTEIIASTTVKWTKDLSDHYPADGGWTLTYNFRKENGTGTGSDALDKTASASGKKFSITLSTTETNKTIGKWVWSAFVSKAGERYRVDFGSFEIKRDLATVTTTFDGRSDAKIAYDNALAIWKAVTADGSYTISGRTWTGRDLPELIAYVDRCKADYLAELQAERIANGEGSKRKILTRFV